MRHVSRIDRLGPVLSSGSIKAHRAAGWVRWDGHRVGRHRLARRTVSGDLVVRTRQGFVTVSFERGTIDSVSGQQLRLTEGIRRATYKMVTVTIPADARVRDNGTAATLSALRAGQRVIVIGRHGARSCWPTRRTAPEDRAS